MARVIQALAGLAIGLLAALGPAAAQTADLVTRSALRVCADPANPPLSSQETPGYENRIAELLGEKLGLPVVYSWFPQATGFVRMTLGAKRCDIIMGYAQGHELVLNTNHYFRSAYALVASPEAGLQDLVNLNDPRLKEMRIGVVAGTPPATVLALNGLMGRVRPYQLMVDTRHDNSAERMVADIAAGEIDAGLLWGPMAGYYAQAQEPPLTVVPLVNETKGPRMTYRITFGVRQGDVLWKRELNDLIAAHQDEINAILLDYGVPILDEQDRPIAR